ncbi:helix-turn-helix transcriptional regulator [Leptotrichia wadei]|jgi:lexA repressor|uniref:helix-turn-helix domain-containing protein n=1 Tax=Leptotrichia wadei TaxID=157687 RepID=UPI00205A59C0|nr:MAG TPA: helix-turn-helix domain protein [Caudoviricetes sp.]
MSFGIVLKNVRKQNGDSLRGLADKINLAFTFIDKVEKGLNPPSENMITRLLKVYPLQKKILSKAYAENELPEDVLKELNFGNITEDFLDSILGLVKTLDTEEQKNILNTILERIEYMSFKSGNYDKVKEMINEAKEKINEL